MVKVQGGTGGGEGGRIEEFDWDGRLVWAFDHATRDYQLHHDIKPMPNGHVLALMVERKSREEAVAAGFDPNQLQDDYLVPDAVVEIEPTPPKGGASSGSGTSGTTSSAAPILPHTLNWWTPGARAGTSARSGTT